MSILQRRMVFPDLVDWFEEPLLTLRPYLAQPIRSRHMPRTAGTW